MPVLYNMEWHLAIPDGQTSGILSGKRGYFEYHNRFGVYYLMENKECLGFVVRILGEDEQNVPSSRDLSA